MERYLDVRRAAHMAGVSTREIQLRLDAGELCGREGKIALSELTRCYPCTHTRGAAMVDVVNQIREDAVVKGLRLRGKKISVQALLAENDGLRRELAFYKEECARQRNILVDLKGMLADVRARLDTRQRPFLDAVVQWLQKRTKKTRRERGL